MPEGVTLGRSALAGTVAALTGGLVPIVAVDADETQRVAETVRHKPARGGHSIKPMSGIVSGLLESGLSV